MIVAVTGGTGFIGRHLIARHCARGDRVRYLTRNPSRDAIAGATAFMGDLTSPGTELRAFVRDADVIYHCAAELRNEAKMHGTNVIGTANLLAATDGEVGRWVQLSSTGIYGRQLFGDVDEDSPANPANAYEISKHAADQLVFDAAEKHPLPSVVVRPSIVYGLDMPNRSLYQLIAVLDKGWFFFIGKPGAIANYVHVENLVDALLLCAMEKLPCNSRTYIVSDHRTLEEFVGIVAMALRKAPPRLRLPALLVQGVAAVAGGFHRFPLSSSRVDALTSRVIFRAGRIQTELGYENRISMEAGIAELVHQWKKLKGRTRDA